MSPVFTAEGEPPRDLHHALTILCNSYSVEGGSNTPDLILATYIIECLKAFNNAVTRRDSWYGGVGTRNGV